jgi:hypothetical protein
VRREKEGERADYDRMVRLSAQVEQTRRRGEGRAWSHCRFVLTFIHVIPDLLRESVPLFMNQQCDRTLGGGGGDPLRDENGSIVTVAGPTRGAVKCPSRVRVSHSQSVFYGAFASARRALNAQKRRFRARAGRARPVREPRAAAGEEDAKLAQKLGQLQFFIAVFSHESMGQLTSIGPT